MAPRRPLVEQATAAGAIIVVMAQVRMTEAEVLRDFKAVLKRIRAGSEIVVEEDARPVAVIRSPEGPGRPIEECIAIAEARQSNAVLDEDFARDLQEIIDSRAPLDTSSWD